MMGIETGRRTWQRRQVYQEMRWALQVMLWISDGKTQYKRDGVDDDSAPEGHAPRESMKQHDEA